VALYANVNITALRMGRDPSPLVHLWTWQHRSNTHSRQSRKWMPSTGWTCTHQHQWDDAGGAHTLACLMGLNQAFVTLWAGGGGGGHASSGWPGAREAALASKRQTHQVKFLCTRFVHSAVCRTLVPSIPGETVTADYDSKVVEVYFYFAKVMQVCRSSSHGHDTPTCCTRCTHHRRGSTDGLEKQQSPRKHTQATIITNTTIWAPAAGNT
jgi:hypothetical protein